MPKGVWADNSGSIHFCRAVVPVANTFAQNNPQNNSESNIKINPRDYSHHTAMIGGYFANFQTNTRASPLKISVISHQIRETILIQPAKLPPFLKLPVMPELIRMPGSSALKRLGQVSKKITNVSRVYISDDWRCSCDHSGRALSYVFYLPWTADIICSL